MGRRKKVSMKIINLIVQGLILGSRSHYVAIGQSNQDVRQFGVYAEDLKDLATWLKKIRLPLLPWNRRECIGRIYLWNSSIQDSR